MTKFNPEDVSLVRRDNDSRDKEVRYGRRTRVARKLKSYDVLAPNGTHLGIVAEEMTTFEHTTPGRMYVNRRWESPRWYFWQGADRWNSQKRGVWRETRRAVVEDLLYRVNRDSMESVGAA
jgi:hypothetical protein